MIIFNNFRVVKGFFCVAAVATVLGTAYGVRAEENTAVTKVLSAGCNTAHYLMQDLTEGIRHKIGLELVSEGTGNKVGAKSLAAGQIDFAFTCQPHDKLVTQFKLDSGVVKNWQSVKIAKDPIVVIVNQQNPITGLSKAQLTDVFSGKVTNWKDVGGEDLEIKLVYQDESLKSGVLIVFREQTVGKDADGNLKNLSENAIRFPDTGKRGAYIAQNRGAITFMALSGYEESFGHLLQIDGVTPTVDNIVKGTYPIAATYYIIYDKQNPKSTTTVEPILSYMASEEGKSVINRNFVADIETKR